MRTLKKITAHVIILGLCLTVAAPGAVLNAKTKSLSYQKSRLQSPRERRKRSSLPVWERRER